jgi:hypothetical protein
LNLPKKPFHSNSFFPRTDRGEKKRVIFDFSKHVVKERGRNAARGILSGFGGLRRHRTVCGAIVTRQKEKSCLFGPQRVILCKFGSK